MSDFIKVELTEEQYDKISKIGITKLEITSLGCKIKIGEGSSDFEMVLMDKDRFNQSGNNEEALDMIDTTSKQGDSLAKGDAVKWKNGDKCITGSEEKIYIAPYPFEEDIHILADEQCVHRAHISVIKKPESLEQKRIEAMVGDFQKYNGGLFYADMAKYLIDLGWSKEQ